MLQIDFIQWLIPILDSHWSKSVVLLDTNPLPWPHGIVKCPFDAHIRISMEVVFYILFFFHTVQLVTCFVHKLISFFSKNGYNEWFSDLPNNSLNLKGYSTPRELSC